MGQTNTFLGTLDEFDKIQSGGGGFYGKVKLETGYKVFVSGLSNADSWFPFEVGNKESQDNALADAKHQLALSGVTGTKAKPQVSVQLTLYKNDVLGAGIEKAEGWKDDRVWTTPKWTDGYTQVIKPALVTLAEAGKPLVWGEMWGHVTFAKDPSGRQKADQNGEMRDELVAYLDDVFPDEAAAELAASGTERVGGGDHGAVSVWDAVKTDADFITALQDAVKGKPKPKRDAALLAVAQEWEIVGAESHLQEMYALAGV